MDSTTSFFNCDMTSKHALSSKNVKGNENYLKNNTSISYSQTQNNIFKQNKINLNFKLKGFMKNKIKYQNTSIKKSPQ